MLKLKLKDRRRRRRRLLRGKGTFLVTVYLLYYSLRCTSLYLVSSSSHRFSSILYFDQAEHQRQFCKRQWRRCERQKASIASLTNSIIIVIIIVITIRQRRLLHPLRLRLLLCLLLTTFQQQQQQHYFGKCICFALLCFHISSTYLPNMCSSSSSYVCTTFAQAS